MPITKTGKEVMSNMMREYGEKKGKEVFYASINAGKAGSSKWHGKKKKKSSGKSYDREHIKLARKMMK